MHVVYLETRKYFKMFAEIFIQNAKSVKYCIPSKHTTWLQRRCNVTTEVLDIFTLYYASSIQYYR